MPLALPKLPSSSAAIVVAAATFLLLRRRLSATRLPAAMPDTRPSPLLVLCTKSLEENDLARSLKTKKNTLKLSLDQEKEEKEEIRVLLHSELDSTHQQTFRAHLYMDALSATRFGRLLIWSPRLPSTHDLVSQNFCELPLGTVCVADIQFKGRGRAKNVWESPVGCLLFSFTMQMEDGHKLPLLQYVVSLAMTEAIKDACQAKGLSQLDVRIKWPNDLYLNGLKIGGILCTSTYRSKTFNVCAGKRVSSFM